MVKIRTVFLVSLPMLLTLNALAQPNRVVGRIAGSQRIPLAGHIHPKAQPENDQGRVSPNFNLARVTVVLHPSASQQAALNQLLVQQQDPTSPNFHHWLTPEEYADRFGVSQDDMNQIGAWLQGHNLTLVGQARARNWIAVSGPASAVEGAFGTEIHHYLANGERHYANATEPSIPAALQGIVVAIRGLNNFRLKPASKPRGSAPITTIPLYNNAQLCGDHCLGPDDVATVYNIAPLLSNGTNGSGQKLVVVGQTQVRLTDIEQFRSFFNLAANDPQIVLVPGEADPGISTGDLSEADLDLEMAGAVARNANIIYVYSSDVTTSEQYAVDQNLAPVISSSYGDCEAAFAPSDITSMQMMAQQANAQGITWFSASGDNGVTDCQGDSFPGADSMVSVDVPASIPEVTGVGGSEFNEGAGTFWSATNNNNNASVLSYIPEMAWNDTALDGSPSASGGGASTYFAKPSWQAGTGVPTNNFRNVPDISISASADHDGYLIFTSDSSVCGGRRSAATMCEAVFGGTSVGAPLFSGLAALLNQSVVSKGLQSSAGLGNINPKLYSLAQSTPAAFHDITTGNNSIQVTCASQRSCVPTNVTGFNAGPGYDQVTGLGTVDASALFTAWIAGGGHSTPPAPVPPTITAVGSSASYTAVYAPGMIVTILGSQLSPVTMYASGVPLPPQMNGVTVTINGVQAPLWYIAPGIINAQIPYETPVGAPVQVIVNNNGQSATTSFVAAAAAPGIYTDAQNEPLPNTSASVGQTISMYVTGVGALSPAISDGVAPAPTTPVGSLPVPQQPVTVTVGGVNAQFATVVPWGLVGIALINYQVPNVASGPQPVVVTVGGIKSKAVTLNVQ